MPAPNPNAIFLRPTDYNEVKTTIMNLKKKCPGWDDVDALVVKETVALYIEPLTKIINLSLTEGIFPNELKTAKITPIYKSEDVTLVANYRPVSVLSVFSKILERIMYTRIISFINENNLLYKYQFGFRKGHSTEHALISLVDKISEELDSGKQVLGVFLDFSKAFDTVDHKILLSKLNHYGIRGPALNCVQSYLENILQYVLYNGVSSSRGLVKSGVPQGSVLGPLLYLIYVNDIANVSPNLLPILFADDTNVFLSGDSVDEMILTMNIEIKKITDWTVANKLSINIKKTHYMIFTTKRRTVNTNNNITINGKTIDKVEKTEFLGVITD